MFCSRLHCVSVAFKLDGNHRFWDKCFTTKYSSVWLSSFRHFERLGFPDPGLFLFVPALILTGKTYKVNHKIEKDSHWIQILSGFILDFQWRWDSSNPGGYCLAYHGNRNSSKISLCCRLVGKRKFPNIVERPIWHPTKSPTPYSSGSRLSCLVISPSSSSLSNADCRPLGTLGNGSIGLNPNDLSLWL